MLWFTSAARLAKDDPERQRQNRIRATTWARQAFTPLHGFRGAEETGYYTAISLHPGGRHLLGLEHRHAHAADGGHSINVWDVETEQRVPLPKAAGTAIWAEWSPDGKWLALGSDTGSVTLTDFPAGTEVQDVPFPTSVRQLSFSADGHFLAIFGDSKSRVWDRREKAFITGEMVHPARVDSVVFSPHGDRLVTGCWDAHVRVFAVDGSAAQPLFRFRPDDAGEPDDDKKPIYPIFIDEGSKLLTVQGTQLIWSDAKNGKRIRSIPVPELTRPTVTLSAQGKYAAVHGGKSGNAFVQMIDLEKGEPVGPILKHSNEVAAWPSVTTARLW